ncbi:SDR family NAD(P)-dependent oxidoreductase [Ornithinimicrobium panacihumi]|uniref:SDR family NAD(P)-dependent oxidoreductase n=1 Tax=Ornithinimicrobium panacihumi TaxID=2008449 RepID=UPI003F89A04A
MQQLDYARMFRLDGRSAVVLGVGGIGGEIAAGLAAQGARVHCLDKSVETAGATRDRLEGTAAAGHTAYPVDVLEQGAVEALAEELGDLDVLVLTAAMNVRKRLLDYSAEEFERVVALNLRGVFDAVRAFAPRMVERGSGSIVVLTSIRAVTVEPGQGVYAATKAGAMQLVRTWAAELGPAGVRINAVAPGVVETPLTQQIRDDEGWGRAYAEKSALGRWARPEEMVGAVCWLASDAASFVTGSQVMVDGGWTAIDGRFTPPFG